MRYFWIEWHCRQLNQMDAIELYRIRRKYCAEWNTNVPLVDFVFIEQMWNVIAFLFEWFGAISSNVLKIYSIIIVSREKNCIILLRITKRIWKNKVVPFDTFLPETDERRVILGGLGVKNRGCGERTAEKSFWKIFVGFLRPKILIFQGFDGNLRDTVMRLKGRN